MIDCQVLYTTPVKWFSLCFIGLSNTTGLYCRRDVKALQDADAIACMRAAGAIPFAITNVSEVCMWWESNNTVYGRSNNPYNTNHIVGGSSGGEVSFGPYI
jgi:Asp-tRNAAsn/Glu-tRNAGln amidotransferase A subunit and related amidases